jgi:hypothetical protein
METDRITRALRWAGLALGLAQMMAPHTGRRVGGADPRRGIVRAAGMRGLMHAALLLGSRRPARWTWSRGAGGAPDLAAPGRAADRRRGNGLRRMGGTSAPVTGITAADLLAARLGSGAVPQEGTRAPRTVRQRPARPVAAGREGERHGFEPFKDTSGDSHEVVLTTAEAEG